MNNLKKVGEKVRENRKHVGYYNSDGVWENQFTTKSSILPTLSIRY